MKQTMKAALNIKHELHDCNLRCNDFALVMCVCEMVSKLVLEQEEKKAATESWLNIRRCFAWLFCGFA